MIKKIILIAVVVLFLVFTPRPLTSAACPLLTGKAYKISGRNGIYYVTQNCTKKVFSDSSVYFTYFDSFKAAIRVAKNQLDRVPADVKYVMQPAGVAIPQNRMTTWNPGIIGGFPKRFTVCARADDKKYGSGNLDSTSYIQGLIDKCPEGQVVYLPAGNYKISGSIIVNKGVVLRGDGPGKKGQGGTQIRAELPANSSAAIYLANLWPTYDKAINVTANVIKGSKTIPVQNGALFSPGDIVQIDQLDDLSYVDPGGCRWWKRPDYGPASSGLRSLGQTVEVVSVNRNILTIATPLHLNFNLSFSPQVFKPTGPKTPSGNSVKYAGLEDIYVTGGQNNNIHIMNCAFCWVSNVESDGTTPLQTTAGDGKAGPGNGMKGAHLQIDRSYKVVVRDSYFHDATNIVQGGGAYGISLGAHTSDSLIENNIIINLNKPFTLRASGGGNVVAYNYMDNAWTSAMTPLQETTLDMGHCSFSFMELVEGNYAPQIATDKVWGNSGWMTVFRNYASGEQERTIRMSENDSVAAIDLEAKSLYFNVVGNILGKQGMVYEVSSNPPGRTQPAVWRLGNNVSGGNGNNDQSTYEDPKKPGTSAFTLLRTGNYDFVSRKINWSSANHYLPPSLYLNSKPSFFGNRSWPWVDPEKGFIGVLPAKERYESLK